MYVFFHRRRGDPLTLVQLLVAEVQALMGDGAMSLHTRSLKYGKASPTPLRMRRVDLIT
jgi:exosome complex RNA-binding protein Rrp4